MRFCLSVFYVFSSFGFSFVPSATKPVFQSAFCANGYIYLLIFPGLKPRVIIISHLRRFITFPIRGIGRGLSPFRPQQSRYFNLLSARKVICFASFNPGLTPRATNISLLQSCFSNRVSRGIAFCSSLSVLAILVFIVISKFYRLYATESRNICSQYRINNQ
jgi:hypothetical protein